MSHEQKRNQGQGQDNHSVVVPAVGAASSTACLRSLGRRGIHTIAVAEHENAPSLRSRYCKEVIEVPSPTEDLLAYKNALLALAARSDVRTIAPLREAEAYVLSRYRKEFAEHIATPWPSFRTLRDAHDRLRLAEVANAAGVTVPETDPLDAVSDWDRRLIAKARYGALTAEYVDSVAPTEFVEVGSTIYLQLGREPDPERLVAEMGHVPIVQEYVPGKEVAFWALYDHGEAVATCQRNRVRGYKYAGGASVYRQTVRIPALERAGRALLDALEWNGLAAVQFMYDEETGELSLMEINPRFWLSLPCAVRAGADFPYYYWQLAGTDPSAGRELRSNERASDGGSEPAVNPGYEVGVGTHLLRGEGVYLHSILREDFEYVERPAFTHALWKVLSSIYRQPSFDYLTREDPAPFVRDALNTVRNIL